MSYEPSGDGRAQSGKRRKIDYREVLNDADFTVYARLRSLRKEIADTEGVPVYSLFTNEQLAEMARRRTADSVVPAGCRDPVPWMASARSLPGLTISSQAH